MKIEKVENREWKIEWKMLLSTILLEKENREERKLERKFSLLGSHFLSSQTGRKIWEEKCFHSIITQIPSPTYPHSWPDDPLTYPTWWLFAHKSSLSLFCLFSSCIHQRLAVQVLFFFFFNITWSKSFAQLNLYVHYWNFYIIIIKIIIKIYIYDVVNFILFNEYK